MADVTKDVLAERLSAWVEAQGGDMPISYAKREVKWFFDEITSSVLSGDRVVVSGFGRWFRGRNGYVRFKVGSKLRG